ncbi:MAG TPA: hypothetical protein VD789_06325 [Thermomicrobiales bacterium]|nr:hypothetical protein [Thermomicrobiales bacterium]
MKAGLFAYAWDLEAEGYDSAIGQMAANGVTHLNLATAYHAGKFLLPRNLRHRTFFPEDGSIYFRPELSRYGRIRPRVNSLVSHTGDPASRLEAATGRYGIDYVAWVVLMHNSWLGARYPDVTMHTAFGDPIIHSLNPAHPDVREYVLALIGDLVSHHQVAALVLEAPGYMTYTHGWHHEFGGVALDPVQERLMSISFSPQEVSAARDAGVEAERVRDAVAALLDRSWNEAFALSREGEQHPDAAALLADPDLLAYLRWQDEQVVSLADRIRHMVRSANPNTEIRHFATLNGREASAEVLATGDGILAGYASSDEDATARAHAAGRHGKSVFGMVRAMPPDTTEPGQIARRVEAWRSAGVDGVDTYNYGFLTRTNLRELYDALR